MRIMLVAIVVTMGLLFYTASADAHYKSGSHNAIHAISLTWCGKGPLIRGEARCYRGRQATRVARCEASARYWHTRPQEAVNGQYKGMFQMGGWARGRYGHGPSVWHQARAAYRNWRENGWQNQWECAVILGIS